MASLSLNGLRLDSRSEVVANYNPNTATLSGKALASTVVTITVDGVTIGTTTSSPTGDWSYQFTSYPPPTAAFGASVPLTGTGTIDYPASPETQPLLLGSSDSAMLLGADGAPLYSGA